MRFSKQTWAIGLVLAASLLMPMLGCTWKEDIWRESSASKTPNTRSDAHIEPDAEQDAAGQVGDEENANGSQEFPSAQERIALAFQSTKPSLYRLDRVIDGNVVEWPDMKYLGEAVTIQSTSITPLEVRIVAGGDVPVFYSPEEDDTIYAPTGIPRHLRGHVLPAVMIPPGASLVMLRMNAEYEGLCTRETASNYFWFSGLGISYPQYGASDIIILEPLFYPLGEFNSVTDGCSNDGWAYFLVPGIDLDPAKLWLEYDRGSVEKELTFWTVTEKP